MDSLAEFQVQQRRGHARVVSGKLYILNLSKSSAKERGFDHLTITQSAHVKSFISVNSAARSVSNYFFLLNQIGKGHDATTSSPALA